MAGMSIVDERGACDDACRKSVRRHFQAAVNEKRPGDTAGRNRKRKHHRRCRHGGNRRARMRGGANGPG